MDILTAHEMLAKRQDRSALDCDVSLNCPLGPCDAWPAAATAAVALSGCLEDAATDADLDEGLAHFQYLWTDGIVTQEQWDAEMIAVIDAVMEWGEQQPHQASLGSLSNCLPGF